ncbi:hypothetical protein BLA60_36410 [Actinophytocola xinjiangensis]|uniref:Uncharacterized protein n=1 Tax=Actinophytocola xinjiangensis TaxID=485602 RepID=A0A7Z0WE93_9PSEU|nr:hypothetical protein [Actinophytocola xinjiangensis]OLF05317.1 hypothetical protein BLA60_36410 [Actinophytocola xinjiangensis]
MNVASLSFTLDGQDAVRLWVSRTAPWMCLVVDADGAYTEIRMDREHARALCEQIPSALAGLDKWFVEDVRREDVEAAGRRAVDLTAQALDLAATAERVGAHEQASALRTAAAATAATVTAVDDVVRGFEDATAGADRASESLLFVMSEAGAALRCRQPAT